MLGLVSSSVLPLQVTGEAPNKSIAHLQAACISLLCMVGVTGFEPATPTSRTKLVKVQVHPLRT